MGEKVKGEGHVTIAHFKESNHIMLLFHISLELVLLFLSYNLCLLIGVFRSFTFNAIIGMLSLSFWFSFSVIFPLVSFSLSSCGLHEHIL